MAVLSFLQTRDEDLHQYLHHPSIDELGVAIMFLCGVVLFSPRLITVNVHDPATGGL